MHDTGLLWTITTMGITMGQRTSELICDSYPRVASLAEQAGTLMYGRLFQIAPEVLPQFRRDLSDPELSQVAAHRFVQLITFIRTSAESDAAGGEARAVDSISRLANRHVGYRTEAPHYAPLGRALMWAMERCLGEEFTPSLRNAWETAYDALAVTMVEPLGAPLS